MPLLLDFDLACKLQMSHVFCKVSGGFTKISQVKMNWGGGGGLVGTQVYSVAGW